MRNRSILLPLLFILLFTSCREKFQRYDIDGELDPYLQLFLEEGKRRGMNFDVEKNGLLMEFTDLPGKTIGLCTYQDPLLVQIDRPYWEETVLYEDQENLRQNVVFHELGHGLLNRGHDNSLLPNLEWKTIMCGGDAVEGRDWSVNFNGYRKEYYLNELFNTRTEAPAWSQPIQFDGNKGTLWAELDLDNDFYNADNSTIQTIHNHLLTILSKDDGNVPVPLSSNYSLTQDFYYEITMKYTFTDDPGFFGPFASYDYDHDGFYKYNNRSEGHPINDGINYMAVHPSDEGDQMFLLNSNCYLPIAEILKDGMYDKGDYNKFAIARHDGELFFYLNDQLVFRNDYQADMPYHNFGVLVPPMGQVEISASQLYIGGSTLRSDKSVDKFTPGGNETKYGAVNPLMKMTNYIK